MNKYIRQLRQYFETSSKWQLDKDYDDFSVYNRVGPSVDEYVFMTEMRISNQSIINPEFSLDSFVNALPLSAI